MRCIMNRLVHHEPTLVNPVSQLCTEYQFSSPAYIHWCRLLHEHPRHHRKQWEFCYVSQALAEAGALAPERRGLGFGVGTEPFCAAMATLGCHLTATDQDTRSAT